MTARQRSQKRPAIPQEKRTKYKLEELHDAFANMIECRKRIGRDQAYGKEQWEEVNAYFDALKEVGGYAVRLVRLDNTQLYHPIVQFLLKSGRRKSFLKRLHRGLEVGVKDYLGKVKGVLGEGETKFAFAVMVLNVLNTKKSTSYTQKQRYLTRKGWIKRMSPQAFHKMARRMLVASKDSGGPRYNLKALPIRPKKILPEWSRAQKLVEDWSRIEEKSDSSLIAT